MEPMIMIQQEKEEDHQRVREVVEEAFREEKLSDHSEHLLVDKLRSCSEAFVPELSLVALENNQIVGHIMLTKIKIVDNVKDKEVATLCLAPMSVHPSSQNQGIGGKLIRHAHKIAASLGFESIIVLGHPKYYPRFGYKRLIDIGKGAIKMPIDCPAEACMGLELVDGSLTNVSGVVKYSAPFGI